MPQRHKDCPGPLLGYSMINGVDDFPKADIAPSLKLLPNGVAVIVKFWGKESPHIFQHHGLWATFSDKAKRLWKQVAPVKVSQLFSGHRKGGTWHTASQKINAQIFFGGKRCHITFYDIPKGAVFFQRRTGVTVNFHQCGMFKASLFQAKRLPTGTGANFHGTHRLCQFCRTPTLILLHFSRPVAASRLFRLSPLLQAVFSVSWAGG